jgi:hypothetical protein
MKHFNFIVALIVSSLIPLVTAVCGQSGASTESRMANARVIWDIHVQSEQIPLVLGRVLRGTDLSGGVAEEMACSTPPIAQLDVKQGTPVQDAMDSFVAGNPGDRWMEDTDVVNLMATTEFPLLNTRIPNFELDTTDAETARSVLNGLLDLPQVRERAAKLDLKVAPFVGGMEALPRPGYPQPTPRPIRLSLHDVSLQEAFNSVIRFYRSKIWIYEERQCNGVRTYLIRTSDA